MNEGQEVSQSQNLTQSNAEAAAEKLVPQHEVNSLVGGAKQRGYEKGYQQALSELQQKQAPQQMGGIAQAQQQMNPIGDENRMRQIAADEHAKAYQSMQQLAIQQAQHAEGTRILNELGAKFNEAKSRIPDFDNVVKINDFHKMPEVLHYANMVDNSGDVMYDLAQNPSKIATIRSLSESSPQFALKEVKKLSDSIKQNQNALTQPQAPAPLGQVSTSNIGVDTSGKPNTAAGWRKYHLQKAMNR